MLVAVMLIVGVIFLFSSDVLNTQIGENLKPSAGSCSLSSVITANGVNELNKGSAVSSPTVYVSYFDNGAWTTPTSITSGTTALTYNKLTKLFLSKSDYIDTVTDEFYVPCGAFTKEVGMYYSTSDNPAIRVKNDDGDYVTDAIADGAINQTNLALGEVLKMDIEFSGTSLESSSDGVYIIEFPAGSSANITKVELSGATMVGKPTVHSTNNAGSYVVAFDVPAVVGSDKAVHVLTVTLGATKDLSGGVYTDWYAKQYFIDDDGSIKYGVEDSDGTAKYENTLDFDFFINSA